MYWLTNLRQPHNFQPQREVDVEFSNPVFNLPYINYTVITDISR